VTDKPKKPKQRKPNVGSDTTVGSKVWWWQIGMYAFAIGASLMLIGLTILRLVQGRFTVAPAVAAVVVAAMSWTLLTSSEKAVVEPGGIKVGSSEPELTEFVNSISKALGAPEIDAMYVVMEPRLTVAEENRYFGLKYWRRVMIVGLPFLHSLSKTEFAALTAHHLGHYTEGHVHEGVRGMRALRAGNLMIASERDGAVNGVFGSYSRKMSRSVGGVGVAQEQGAERAAVDAYGTEAMLSGLAKLDDVESAWNQMLRDYVVPALQQGAHPADLFTGFESLLASTARKDDRADDVEKRVGSEASEFEPHKTPGQRAALVTQWPAVEGSVDLDDGDALAYTLLDPEAKSTEIVIGTWARTLMDSKTEPRSWQELNDDVYSTATYKFAQRGFAEETDAIDQFEQVLDWSDTEWSELDEALSGVKSLKRLDPLERRASWVAAIVTEAVAASDHYHWQQNWEGPPPLVSAEGEQLDAEPIASLILNGDSARARAAFDRVVSAETSVH